jgi:hypothetical protein
MVLSRLSTLHLKSHLCIFWKGCAAQVPISTSMCLWATYILYSQDRSTYFFCSRLGRPIGGIYVLFAHRNRNVMYEWELGLRPRNFFSGNICFDFSVLCLSSAAWSKMRRIWSPLSRLAFNFADLVLQKQVSWDNRYYKLSSDRQCTCTSTVVCTFATAMLGHMATKFKRFISWQEPS